MNMAAEVLYGLWQQFEGSRDFEAAKAIYLQIIDEYQTQC